MPPVLKAGRANGKSAPSSPLPTGRGRGWGLGAEKAGRQIERRKPIPDPLTLRASFASPRGKGLIPRQPFFMFSSPLIPPGLRLGWLALVFGASLLALGLRASFDFFCWPLAIGTSDQRARCPSAERGPDGVGCQCGA